MSGAGSPLAIFGLLVLIGLPVALSIRDAHPDWVGVAFESAVIGLVVELFVAIVLLHNRHSVSYTHLTLPTNREV